MNALIPARVHGCEVAGQDRGIRQLVSPSQSAEYLGVELRIAGRDATSSFVVEKEEQLVLVVRQRNWAANVAAELVEADVVLCAQAEWRGSVELSSR